MYYTPISPFKRPISHAHLRVIERPESAVTARPVNKWDLLRELSKAQAAFGISERDLTVLQGLLSFFPEAMLGETPEMVVFPSNKAICERLNGMACSTMRRHIGRLVAARLILRRDSPNGKRYVRKHGEARMAFGFDLSPLHARAEEIARAAEAVRQAEDHIRRLREVVSLMRRDLAALAEFGETIEPGRGFWDQLRDKAALTARALRRKLPIEELTGYKTELAALLDQARNVIDGLETEELNTSDARFEQHHHNSEIKTSDLEPAVNQQEQTASGAHDLNTQNDEGAQSWHPPKIPLHLVTTACPSLRTFYHGEIRHWHQLYEAACHLRPAMGIAPSAWTEAQRCMGPEQASIVVAAILERFDEIRSPGGYLRALTAKAAAGAFSCGPMVMALMSRKDAA